MKAIIPIVVLILVALIVSVPNLPRAHVSAVSGGPNPPPPDPGLLGGPLVGLTSDQNDLFLAGYDSFNFKWDPIRGLGPVFNGTACMNCHGGGQNNLNKCLFNPTKPCLAGGTSTLVGTRYGKWNSDGTFNYLDGDGTFPSNEGGPVLHTQSVGQFGTQTGCTLSVLPPEHVPSDATVVSKVRSPAVFGFGLIDAIPESTILANAVPKPFGIQGVPNMVVDPTTGQTRVGRMGQKSSFPSLFSFTASAEFNEFGITVVPCPGGDPTACPDGIHINEHLPQGQPTPFACVNPDPNNPQDVSALNAIQMYQFQSMLAPPPPTPPTDQTIAGKAVFDSIGCNLCHVESMTTGPNVTLITDLNGGTTGVVDSLSNQQVFLYSDLLLHNLGSRDAGGIPQGQAGLQQWRTAPLWGLSNRIPIGLMHNNLAKDVNTAIVNHGGEAIKVINNYKSLSATDQLNLIAFLSSL